MNTQKQTITAKLSGFDTGYEILKDYSEKSTKLTNKAGYVITLPTKCLDIEQLGTVYRIELPLWLFNKNYAFFNSY